MTKAERELRELSCTLFCTGRFRSRAEAEKAARAQLQREAEARAAIELERKLRSIPTGYVLPPQDGTYIVAL